MIQQLTLIRPDDWHLHLRQGELMKRVLPHTVQQFGRALIMPNLAEPVITTAQAGAYRDQILAALAQTNPGSGFEPLMTLFLTEQTSAQEIRQAHASGLVHGVKFYPAQATTHSDHGVRDWYACKLALAEMERLGLPLSVHGEVTDSEVDPFDREQYFIDRVMVPLTAAFPALKIIFEHITTVDAVDYVRAQGGGMGATLTAHHLRFNRSALFQGGLRPDYHCLPVLKRERHRQALVAAATSGEPMFFLGTDSAPHPRGRKYCDHGCAGCYTALHALPLYLEIFEQARALDRFEAFASVHGAHFRGLSPNVTAPQVTLTRTPWTVPEVLFEGELQVVPLCAGAALHWRVVED